VCRICVLPLYGTCNLILVSECGLRGGRVIKKIPSMRDFDRVSPWAVWFLVYSRLFGCR